MPLAFISHVVVIVSKLVYIDIGFCIHEFYQIFIILLAHIVVRYSEYKLCSSRSLDGKHAIIKQQAWKYLWVCYHSCREGIIESSHNLSFLGNRANHSLSVTI